MNKETLKDLKELIELPEKFEQLQISSELQFLRMQQIIAAILLMNNGKIEIPRETWHKAKELKYWEYLGEGYSQGFKLSENNP